MTITNFNQRYDEAAAMRLVPLLSGIVAEIRDRSIEIHALRRRLGELCSQEGELPVWPEERNEALELRARLATQLRERRFAREDFEILGCFYTDSDRLVRIPGPSGTLEDGFLWGPGEDHVAPMPTVEFEREALGS